MKISPEAKRLIIITAGLSLAGFGIGAFFAANLLTFFLGVLIGVIASAIRIILLDKAVDKALQMTPKDATLYMRANYTGRQMFTAAALLLSVFVGFIDFYGTIIGIGTMPISAYLVKFFFKEEV